MPDEESSGFDDYTEEYRRNELIYKESLLGLEYWEYAWVRPESLSDYGADRWRVVYMMPWHEGRLLMERKRIADDDSIREITG